MDKKVATHYTKIKIPGEIPPSPPKDTFPDLPPRTSVEKGVFSPAYLPRKPQTISLIQFAKRFSDKFPVHVKVSQGFYGTSTRDTISGQQELVILCEKRREVLRIRSKSGKLYSIPYGSSVPISLLYDLDENERKAKTEMTSKSLASLSYEHMPKVIACSTSDGKLPVSSNEILVIKIFNVQNRKLHVYSIPSKDESSSVSEKELNLYCKSKTTFSTKPNMTALYLSDIIKYVHSPCERSSTALLDLSKLSSSDYDEVMHTDPMLSEPVVLVESKTEASLVAVTAEKSGSFENSQFFEIPLEEKFGVEFTILDTQNAMYSSLQPPSYPSFFSPRKLKLWVTDTFEPSQAIQQIFNSSLRSGHEMEGINIPQGTYEEIAASNTTSSLSASTMPASIPVSSNPSYVYSDMPPQLPLKQKPTTQPSPPKAPQQSIPGPVSSSPSHGDMPPHIPPKPKPRSTQSLSSKSPQQSKEFSLDTKAPEPAESSLAQDFTTMRELKEMIDKAVRETLSGPLERLLSIKSSDPDSPLETLMTKPILHHEKKQSNKLTPDELCEIVSELADCEGQWFYLAVYLGVPKSRIDQISATYSSDSSYCRRGLIEAVSYWLDNSPDASWSAIVKALYMMEKKNKARELAEKYDVDIPSIDYPEDPTSLHSDLNPKDKEEVKRIRKLMEQKYEELQNTHSNITKHKQKLERLENELAEVKRKLEFNEEYALVLMYGSKISDLKMKSQREGVEETAMLSVKDKVVYERRIQNVQAETTKLQQQLIWIERECRTVNGSLQSSQKQKVSLSQGLMKLEERLNELVMGGCSAQDTEETQLESPEYYNIIVKNGTIEQKMHQKEITQLQKDLKSKEDQLRELKDMLQQSQETLAQVEQRLASQYSYVEPEEDFFQDESQKTSLQADKVDCHLKIANVHFSKAETQLKLEARERKMQRSKQMNQLIQSKMQQTDTPKAAAAAGSQSLTYAI